MTAPLTPRSRALLDAVLSRLNPILPAGLVVVEREGIVGVLANDQFFGGMDFGFLSSNSGLTASDVRAAYNVLSTVQDQVAETLKTPWPPSEESTEDPLALPFAEIVNGELCLGYVAGDRRVLTLAPVTARDLVV